MHDAAIAYMTERHPSATGGFLPVVAETWDGTLNDVRGRHVQKAHVFAALDTRRGGPVAEGNVGGGTGMICYRFKCGIGTSSRRLSAADGGYTVGVLVQANFGRATSCASTACRSAAEIRGGRCQTSRPRGQRR